MLSNRMEEQCRRVLFRLAVGTLLIGHCWSPSGHVSALAVTGEMVGGANALDVAPLAADRANDDDVDLGGALRGLTTAMPLSMGTPVSVFENDTYGN